MSVEEILARHPWPAELLAQGTPMHWLWRFELDVPADRLWPHIIDTSRFNRAMGITRMQFEERDGVLRGSTVNLGMAQEWTEVPWDWAWEKSLISVRKYDRGLGKVARAVYELEAIGENKCVLQVYFGYIPRNWLASLVLRVGLPWLEKNYRKMLAEIEKALQNDSIDALMTKNAPELDDDRRARLNELRKRLEALPVDREAVAALIRHIESGDEMDLFRIQVPKLAHELDLDEDTLLLACLHATRVGLLELSWDVLCPHCRGVRKNAEHLGQLGTLEHCNVCAIDIDTGHENAIEVTFRVHPSVRTVPPVFFCSAEPARKSHVRVQQRLEPGQSRTIQMRSAAGSYRARLRGQTAFGSARVDPGAAQAVRWSASEPLPKLACSTECAIELVNDTNESATFVIEEPSWSDRALRPSRLFSMQSFRDLFSEEYLGAEVQLSVGKQTIVFTDVVGSTRFYKERGDPEAFVEVKRHFARIYEQVAKHRGAVIKTIGDAVMAGFVDSADALRAAGAIQRAFPEGSTLRVRISMHAGPCIAVNLNSGVDYFGSTVNVAAKLQASADAGEVAFSRVVYDAPGAKEALAEEGAGITKRELEISAIGENVEVFHWVVAIE